PGSFVVLHCAGGTNPGMALLRKRWPVESFRALAECILAAGASVVLVGAPEDREGSQELGAAGKTSLTLTRREHPPAPSTRRGAFSQGEKGSEEPSQAERGEVGRGQVVNLVGELSLDEVAALARRAAAYVGNDSGPAHLAEAAGANIVMLFGPS